MRSENKENMVFAHPVEPLLLRAKEAAHLCGLSVSTWYEFRSAGRIPPSIKIGKARLWRLDVLRRWVELDCPNLDKFMAMEQKKC